MLILASLSPRRRELMKLITEDFAVAPPDTDENLPAATSPADAVRALAFRKAAAVSGGYPEAIVIGADTVVALGNEILGKPHDAGQAARMLRALSGREHVVYTGVAIVNNKDSVTFYEKTSVRFRELEDAEIAVYVDSGEPMDKAGAYGIQGRAALFISGISGDYYSVMGLPVCRLAQELRGLYCRTGGKPAEPAGNSQIGVEK